MYSGQCKIHSFGGRVRVLGFRWSKAWGGVQGVMFSVFSSLTSLGAGRLFWDRAT